MESQPSAGTSRRAILLRPICRQHHLGAVVFALGWVVNRKRTPTTGSGVGAGALTGIPAARRVMVQRQDHGGSGIGPRRQGLVAEETRVGSA